MFFVNPFLEAQQVSLFGSHPNSQRSFIRRAQGPSGASRQILYSSIISMTSPLPKLFLDIYLTLPLQSSLYSRGRLSVYHLSTSGSPSQVVVGGSLLEVRRVAQLEDGSIPSNATKPPLDSPSGPLTLKETDYRIIRDILKKLIERERALDHDDI